VDAGDALGLIAGGGRLPLVLAEAARAQGYRLVVIAIERGAEDAPLPADAAYEAGPGKMHHVLEILRREGARRVLLAGRVSRARLVGEGDAEFRARLDHLTDRGDQTVVRRVVVELLGRAGITVASPLEFVRHLLVPEGPLTRRTPAADEWEDVRAGFRLARAVATLDLGQTVVVKRGVVLAVEAAEGTDETIRRGGRFARGVVVAKAARPDQDERFDIPAAGLVTIQTVADAGGSVLALEAGRTLLLDRPECLDAADRAGVAVVGIA
jgi:DUF1009 family protein